MRLIIERLSEASKAVVVVGAALYAIGFFVIFAYMARFGMMSFDFVNSRFIVAGLHAALWVVAAVFVAWQMSAGMPEDLAFKAEDSIKRSLILIRGLLFLYIVSVVAVPFTEIGVYIRPSTSSTLEFVPYSWDLVGQWCNHYLSVGHNASATFLIRSAACIWVYSIVLLLLIALLFQNGQIRKFISGLQSKESSDAAVAAELGEVMGRIKAAPRQVEVWGFRALEVSVISLYLSTWLYAALRLRLELMDFGSFPTKRLTLGLILAWFSAFSIPLALLMTLFGDPRKYRIEKIADKVMMNPYLVAQVGVVPLLVSVLMFGSVIFPRIPYAVGGGEPRHVRVEMRNLERFSEQAYLLGESSQLYFLVKQDLLSVRAVQLNKADVLLLETRSRALTEATVIPLNYLLPWRQP